jgi:arabinan endo-1,5-alpha-L-arabinosidase
LEAGSWTDHGSVGVTSRSGQAYNAIDPNLFIYNGGAAASGGYSLLNFGSFYGDIYQVKLDEALTMTAGSAAYNIEYNSKGTRPCEGSYMFQYGSYYYLLWSHGQCCNYNTYVFFSPSPFTSSFSQIIALS